MLTARFCVYIETAMYTRPDVFLTGTSSMQPLFFRQKCIHGLYIYHAANIDNVCLDKYGAVFSVQRLAVMENVCYSSAVIAPPAEA